MVFRRTGGKEMKARSELLAFIIATLIVITFIWLWNNLESCR